MEIESLKYVPQPPPPQKKRKKKMEIASVQMVKFFPLFSQKAASQYGPC